MLPRPKARGSVGLVDERAKRRRLFSTQPSRVFYQGVPQPRKFSRPTLSLKFVHTSAARLTTPEKNGPM